MTDPDYMHGISFEPRSAPFPPGAAATLCEFFENFGQYPCDREKDTLVKRTVCLLSSRCRLPWLPPPPLSQRMAPPLRSPPPPSFPLRRRRH